MSILTWRFQSNWGPDKVQERLSAWPWVRGVESSTAQAARPTSAQNKARDWKMGVCKGKTLDTESTVFEATAPLGAPSCPLFQTGSDSSWPLSMGVAGLAPSEAWRVTSVQWYQLWGKSAHALWYQHPQLQVQKLPQLWSKVICWGFPPPVSHMRCPVGLDIQQRSSRVQGEKTTCNSEQGSLIAPCC